MFQPKNNSASFASLSDEEKEMLDELEKKLKLLNEQIEQIQSDIAEN